MTLPKRKHGKKKTYKPNRQIREEKTCPKGFECPCGEKHKFDAYVYAHTLDVLAFTCPKCKRKFSVVMLTASHDDKVAKQLMTWEGET